MPTLAAAFTAAHGMVAGILCHAAAAGFEPHPAMPAGFPSRDIFMFLVPTWPTRGFAIQMHQPHFSRRQADMGIVAFLGQQLRGNSGRARQPGFLTQIHFNIVDQHAGRDFSQRQRIAYLDVNLRAGDHIADFVRVSGATIYRFSPSAYCRSAMRAVRLGSYSIAITLAGTPAFSRMNPAGGNGACGLRFSGGPYNGHRHCARRIGMLAQQ